MKQFEKLVVPAGHAIFFLMGFYLTLYQYVLLSICDELNISEGAIGTLAGAQFFALIILPILFTKLSAKIGAKPMILGVMLCFVAGMILLSSAKGMPTLLLGIFFAGAGYGGMESQILPQMTEYNPQRAHKYSNMCAMFYSLGAVISPVAASYLMSVGMHWRTLFVVLAGLGVVLFVMLAITKMYKISVSKKVSFVKQALNPAMLMLICAVIVYVGMETATSSYVNPYFTRVLETPQIAATTLSLFWLSMVPSRFLASFVRKNRNSLVKYCFGLLAICLGLIYFVPSQSTVLLVAAGFLCGPIWPTCMGVGQDAFSNNKSVASTLLMSATGLGGFLMPLLVSLISGASGIKYIYLIVAGLALAGFIVYYLEVKLLKKHSAYEAL